MVKADSSTIDKIMLTYVAVVRPDGAREEVEPSISSPTSCEIGTPPSGQTIPTCSKSFSVKYTNTDVEGSYSLEPVFTSPDPVAVPLGGFTVGPSAGGSGGGNSSG